MSEEITRIGALQREQRRLRLLAYREPDRIIKLGYLAAASQIQIELNIIKETDAYRRRTTPVH